MKTTLCVALLTVLSHFANAGEVVDLGVNSITKRFSVKLVKFEGREIIFMMVDGKDVASASFIGDDVYFEGKEKSLCQTSIKYNKKTGVTSLVAHLEAAHIDDGNIVIRRLGGFKYEWEKD
jgi:hypothetical protein